MSERTRIIGFGSLVCVWVGLIGIAVFKISSAQSEPSATSKPPVETRVQLAALTTQRSEPRFVVDEEARAITCTGGPDVGCAIYGHLTHSSDLVCYNCPNGPCIPFAWWCMPGDFDGDKDVDLDDLAVFLRLFTGPLP